MTASFFFNWFALADLRDYAPLSALVAIFEQTAGDIPLMFSIFLMTFFVAAMNAIICLTGHCSRYLTLATALLPIGLYFYAAPTLGALGLPFGPINVELSANGLNAAIGAAWASFGLGAWMYFGGAVALFLLAVFDPGLEFSQRRTGVHFIKSRAY